jgi:hypothetical protein
LRRPSLREIGRPMAFMVVLPHLQRAQRRALG